MNTPTSKEFLANLKDPMRQIAVNVIAAVSKELKAGGCSLRKTQYGSTTHPWFQMAGAYPVEFEIHAIGRIREDFEEFVDEVLDKHMVQRGIANAECTLDEDSGMIINPIIATLWFNRI